MSVTVTITENASESVSENVSESVSEGADEQVSVNPDLSGVFIPITDKESGLTTSQINLHDDLEMITAYPSFNDIVEYVFSHSDYHYTLKDQETIAAVLKELVDKGYVEVIKRRDGKNKPFIEYYRPLPRKKS